MLTARGGASAVEVAPGEYFILGGNINDPQGVQISYEIYPPDKRADPNGPNATGQINSLIEPMYYSCAFHVENSLFSNTQLQRNDTFYGRVNINMYRWGLGSTPEMKVGKNKGTT